jgi:hypothetical protein
MRFHYRPLPHLEKMLLLLLPMPHHRHPLNWGHLQTYQPRRYYLGLEMLMGYYQTHLFEQARC